MEAGNNRRKYGEYARHRKADRGARATVFLGEPCDIESGDRYKNRYTRSKKKRQPSPVDSVKPFTISLTRKAGLEPASLSALVSKRLADFSGNGLHECLDDDCVLLGEWPYAYFVPLRLLV